MIESIIKEVIDLTLKLIAIPSTHSRPQEIYRITEFIETWLTEHGIRYSVNVSNTIPSICVMPDQNSLQCAIVINCHFDVVESDNPSLFHPFVKEGKLFGRGAIDDKYAVALSLILFREHLYKLRSMGKDQKDMVFGLIFTGDEEIGGAQGMGILAQKLVSDFFIVLDGGSPDLVVTKEKGILLLELEATGKSAHAARPWLGKNAFDMLIDDYSKIKLLFTDDGVSHDHWHKTMVLSQCITGNNSTNMVPQKARATLDIRYTDTDDPHQIVAAITRNIQSTVRIKALEPVFCSGASPYLDLLKSFADSATFTYEHGASDARYLAKSGIPGVIWGADGELSQHTEEEYLVIDSIEPLYRRLENFLNAVMANSETFKQTARYSYLKN